MSAAIFVQEAVGPLTVYFTRRCHLIKFNAFGRIRSCGSSDLMDWLVVSVGWLVAARRFSKQRIARDAVTSMGHDMAILRIDIGHSMLFVRCV